MRKYYFSLIVAIYFFNIAAGQQAWPVQVTGSMVPPHSLNLGVYGAERTQDLTFNALLKDPVEASLQVRLSLSIEQNGNIIYQTDPNYVGMPMTLNQFQNMVLDGNVLRSYLNKDALTGTNRTGTGSLEIPEGFSQICLQVYGLERNVPVSNKFCVSGNFRLNQPPQAVKPACGEKIKMPETQNMIFNWQPMHLGSPNSPGAVEYDFELVQLPQGTFNANDVFDSALKIYKTKTFSAALIYTQAEPQLEANKVYAWRVKASSVMHPTSRLFQNEGVSQICTFILYDGDVPSDDISPINNPAPRGCEVFSTYYGAIDKSDPISASIVEGDIVKLGYFSLKIQSASGGPAGYSGKGWVEYPMLRSMIPVNFSGIKVNQGRRVFESERIAADLSASIALSDAQLRADQIAKTITKDYITTKLIPEVKRSGNYVSELSETGYKVNRLPVALGDSKDKYPVYVIGIQFTPTNAYLNLAAMDAGDAGFAIYAGTAVQATPYGMQNGAHLVPISTSGSVSRSKSIIPTLQLTVSNDGKTRMNCDCKGFRELELTESLQFSPDILSRADNGGPVVLDLKDKVSDKASYFGEAGKMPEFEIKGLEGFTFSAGKSFVDLSESNTVESASKYTSAEAGIVSQAWKGVVIQDASVALPKAYQIQAGKSLVLDKGEILINEDQIPYGSFVKENLVSLDKGKVERWKYSVDKYSLAFQKGQVTGPSISGKLKLPVADNLLDYSGELLQSGNSNAKMNIAMPEGDLNIPMWAAKMKPAAESTIGMEFKNVGNEKMIYPSGNLSGALQVNVSNDVLKNKLSGNVGQALADIKLALGLQTDDLSFSISNLTLNNWNLSPYGAAEDKYKASSVDTEKATMVIGGKTYPVASGEILKKTSDNKEYIGLSVVIRDGNNKINVTLWGAEKKGEFALDHIETGILDIRCNCTMEPGRIGSVELQKLYDRLIEAEFAALASVSGISSGKQSLDLAENPEYKLFHAKKKTEWVIYTSEGGWIVQDGKVLIPFLDVKIRVSKKGNKLEGLKKDYASLSSIQSFDSFDREEQLPIVVNAELFAKLGFHTAYNIPSNSRLLITGFEVADDTKGEGTFTFSVITSMKKADETNAADIKSAPFLHFQSDPIRITNSSSNGIKIANLEMPLQAEYAHDDYVFKVSSTENKKTRRSIARVDCINGFEYFDMTGLYRPQNLKAVDEDTLEMLFTLNTSLHGNAHDLNDFIAVLSDKNSKDARWKFHLPEEPYLIFTTEGSFSMYLDLSSKLKVPGGFVSSSFGAATSGSSFKGIVFEKMAFEILGFNDNHGHHIQFPVADVVYEAAPKGEQKGLNTSYFKEGTLSHRDHNGKFSGWRYELESASYTIANNKFEYNLEIDGKILVPLFKPNLIKNTSVKFSDPWVGFSGTVFSDKEGNTTNVYSNFLLENIVDSTYMSDFIPGLGFLMNEGSSVEMEFDYQEEEWALSAEFNGRAILIINQESMSAIGMKNWPEGMDFSYQALQFEGLKINKGDTGCGNDLSDQYGIGDIEFGTWGVLDDTKDIRESLKEKEEDTSKAETKDNTSGANASTGQSGTTGRARSNALTKNDGRTPSQQPTARSRSNALVKKDPRRPTPKGRARSNAIRGGEAPRKEKPTPEPEFNAMSLSAEVTGIKCVDDNNFELGLNITVNILGDNEAQKSKEQETKTCAINAKGGLGVQFAVKDKKLHPTGIALNCLKFDGSIGPVAFDGGLNILRATNDRTQWGQGFKAYLNGSIEGLGGLAMVGQFGKIKYTEDGVEEKYSYGFLDIEAFVQSGIAFPPPTPVNPPVVDFYGIGGGLRINMELQTAARELEMKKNPAKAPGNDNCTLGEDLLAAGKGFSNSFIPAKGTYGGNIYIIFGPYNVADIGPKPEYQLLSDAGFDIEIGRNDNGAMQFNSIYVNAKAYIKPESIGKRRTENIGDAYANVGYDNRLKKIIGDFGFRAKVNVPEAGTVLKMPIAYDAGEFNKGYMDIGFKPLSFSVKFGGPGINGWKPTSGLSRLDAIMSIPNVIDVKTFAYFQLGKDVDAVPPLEYLIPKLKDAKNIEEQPQNKGNEALDKAANGIAFGANINLSSILNYGPMSASLDAGIGFDLNLRQYDNVTCSNMNNSELGIKGWYAIGQAYAYANGKIDLNYNLLFASGRVKIFDVNGFLYLKAMLPNPSYLKGRLSGDYSVLNGMLSGSFNYKVEIGELCEGIQPPSPIEGLEIFANANINKDQTNVDRYTDIQFATNIALQQDLDLQQLDTEGSVASTASYRADLKEVYLLKKGSTTKVHYVMTRNSNKKGFKLEFENPLDAETEYEIHYTFVWQKKQVINGQTTYIENFESQKGKQDLSPKIETGVIAFKTGDLPQNIQNTMVEYAAPGNKQRYWHKGYADTELKFKLNALADAATLFPDECVPCTQANGGKKVEFEYFVQLVEFDTNGKQSKTYRIPITNRPSTGETAKILTMERVSLNNGEYNMNVLTEKTMPVSKVTFPGLNDIDLVKGALYELKIVRKPTIDLEQNAGGTPNAQTNRQIQNVQNSGDKDVVITIREEKNELANMSQALRNAINENTKILYTSHFAVSNYNTLQDKLALVEVKHQRSITKRRDFQHPNDTYDEQRVKAIQAFGESRFHSTKDDYYVLNIKNNNLEGFDEFDLNRIRSNATLKYNGSYTAEDRLYGERYYDYTNRRKQDIPSQIVNVLDSELRYSFITIRPYADISNYMKKVLFDYREAESKGVAAYGNSRYSDGTKWHYNMSIPEDPKAKLLQDDEIRDKKVIHKNKGYKMKNDPNYSKPVFANDVEFDLLIQDLRSRIIINQMVWLSRLSKDKKDGWSTGNYPEGEFLNETRTASNFNWVLFADQGAENSKKIAAGAYIAQEPGYQFSYHGTSTLSFPSDTKWGEIIESKRDKNPNGGSKAFATLTPIRETGFNEEFKVDNYTELLTDSWYKIKHKGEPLYVNKSNGYGIYIHEKWSVDYPNTKSKYENGQYGIYSGGKGSFLSKGSFRNWLDSADDEDAIWNIVGNGNNKATVINKYRSNDAGQLSDRFKKGGDDAILKNSTDKSGNEWEFVEIPELGFSPEKYYNIGYYYDGKFYVISDDKGESKWKILREGKFYKFISAKGNTIKGHHWDEFRAFGSNPVYYKILLNESFPSNRSDRNDFNRSLWDITQVSYDPKNLRYTIRNVRYHNHFIYVDPKKPGYSIRERNIDAKDPYDDGWQKVKLEIREVR
jgi:hypothetical protein